MGVRFDKIQSKLTMHDHDDLYHTKTVLASTGANDGASLIGIEDAAGEYTATTVEGLIIELASRFVRKTNPTQKDQGYEQNSSIDGVTADYITDKRLSHVLIGSNDRDEEGAIRLVAGTFQIYANGTWSDVVINFVFREDTGELEHQPVGYEWYYEVASGNSNNIGIDGKPIARQYSVDMGAYQTNLLISGGTF